MYNLLKRLSADKEETAVTFAGAQENIQSLRRGGITKAQSIGTCSATLATVQDI